MNTREWGLRSTAVWEPDAERPSWWLTDAAAPGGVQQEAIGTHTRVPATSVGTLPVLATPTCGALIHICKNRGSVWRVGDYMLGSHSLYKTSPCSPLSLTYAGPVNPLKAGWTRSIWAIHSVGVPCAERRGRSRNRLADRQPSSFKERLRGKG